MAETNATRAPSSPDPAAQVDALLAVLSEISSTLNAVTHTLRLAVDHGDVTLAWPCIDALAVAGALADTATEGCGSGPGVKGPSIVSWKCGDDDRGRMRAAGWSVPA